MSKNEINKQGKLLFLIIGCIFIIIIITFSSTLHLAKGTYGYSSACNGYNAGSGVFENGGICYSCSGHQMFDASSVACYDTATVVGDPICDNLTTTCYCEEGHLYNGTCRSCSSGVYTNGQCMFNALTLGPAATGTSATSTNSSTGTNTPTNSGSTGTNTPTNSGSTGGGGSTPTPNTSSKATSTVAPTTSTTVPTTTNTTSNGSNNSNNPQTGTTGIIVAWIVGLAAIIYSLWYFKRSYSMN